MSEKEEVRVDGQPAGGTATPSTTANLEIPDYPKSWEKLVNAFGLGADIILAREFVARKHELGLVALNVAGHAAGQVLRSDSDAITTDEPDWTAERVGAEMKLLSSRVPPAGAEAIVVPAFIKRQLVRWAVNYLQQLAEDYLAG